MVKCTNVAEVPAKECLVKNGMFYLIDKITSRKAAFKVFHLNLENEYF